MKKEKNILNIASACIEEAVKYGASDADVIVFDSQEISVRERMQKPETIELSESKGLGIRVLIGDKNGYRQAIVSTNDFTNLSPKEMADRAIDMAKSAPVDLYTGLAEKTLLAKEDINLDICDKNDFSAQELTEWAKEAEDAALSVDGVTNSEGAGAAFSRSTIALVTTTGFAKQYESTSFSLSASVIAGSGISMETDYDYTISRHSQYLKSPSEVGKTAGNLAVKKLNPKKISTRQTSVIFDKRTAKDLLSSFAGAINGAFVARGTSFLKDKMDQQIFPKDINIIDDPMRMQGIASEPFDGEGVMGKKRKIVSNGVLSSWLLSVRSANQLGIVTTGNASRGISSPPSPSSSNLYMESGNVSYAELISDTKDGIYITEAFGMGINSVTGDYSQGASGFMIENGIITYPVSEITIAGNLKDMFMNLTPSNDLEFLYGTNSPTLRIEGMTIAGV